MYQARRDAGKVGLPWDLVRMYPDHGRTPGMAFTVYPYWSAYDLRRFVRPWLHLWDDFPAALRPPFSAKWLLRLTTVENSKTHGEGRHPAQFVGLALLLLLR